MNDFLNRNWFFISIVVGVVFLAFSAMIQSWMLAITTLIFIIAEYFIAQITQNRSTTETQRSIESFERGEDISDGRGEVRVKIPLGFIALAIFIVVAFIELVIVVFSGF